MSLAPRHHKALTLLRDRTEALEPIDPEDATRAALRTFRDLARLNLAKREDAGWRTTLLGTAVARGDLPPPTTPGTPRHATPLTQRVLETIQAQPGITSREVTAITGITSSHACTALRQLTKRGHVTRTGAGKINDPFHYHPVRKEAA